jgi:hypothetical protein
MSVSIHFQAVIPINGETYRKHAAVRDACVQAKVSLPSETAAFFDDHNEDREVTASGIRVGIDGDGDVMEGDDGALIDLSKLPPGTTKIRVYAAC